MKKLRILLGMVLFVCFFWNISMSTCATQKDEVNSTIGQFIAMEDASLDNAVVISTSSYFEGNRYITETVYKQQDGTIIIDTLDVGAISTLSAKGSDTATRKREIKDWVTITITASFDWYTEGLFAYVRCTGMSAYYSPANSNVTLDKWEKSYTQNYVSIGTASAQVSYYFYNSQVPMQFQSGTFKITCTDDGTISDNG